jgi:hypothetical protein
MSIISTVEGIEETQRPNFELAKIDADLESKLADIQGQNIRADAQSGDKFTSRARPAFLWMMTLAIGISVSSSR